ncbi:MAG: ABC transporter substrate-binding protein [Hylemonella sp.]|nr:ABC transporter substrate-binding protein [Hylemonella sp.]
MVQRRNILKTIGAAAAVGVGAWRPAFAQAKADIVIGAAHPMTGFMSFAGVASNNAMGDYINWRNQNGGILGHKIRYVAEDSAYKVDQGVAVVKKMIASDKPSFIFLDGTPLSKAVARDVLATGSIMTGGFSASEALLDQKAYPHHFLSGPTFGTTHEILMEYIGRVSKAGGNAPKIALVHSDQEFGNEAIPASKARAAKLGLPIVQEIVTKPTGVDVTSEVAKLRRSRPDIVIFQGYIMNPVPEFVKQMREGGLNAQVMSTTYGLDRIMYDALARSGERLTGVMPYRYGYDTESKMMTTMREYVAKVRPQQDSISVFYIHSWLTGMIFCEVAERCIKANKKLTMPNMKAALESMKEWDTGGLTGLLADLSTHQIKSGRVYSYDPGTKRMEPASGWIRV